MTGTRAASPTAHVQCASVTPDSSVIEAPRPPSATWLCASLASLLPLLKCSFIFRTAV